MNIKAGIRFVRGVTEKDGKAESHVNNPDEIDIDIDDENESENDEEEEEMEEGKSRTIKSNLGIKIRYYL